MAAAPACAPSETALPVLTYHSVGRDAAPGFRRWQVRANLLDAQLGRLREAGWRLTGLTDALGSLDRARERTVGVTFDDGFADFASALDTLARHDASATMYIPTNYVGRTARWLGDQCESHRPLLTWRELAALPSSIELGSHSASHRELDALPPSALAREIVESRQRIEQEIGRRVDSFCYPFGFHDRPVRRTVRLGGYRNACEMGYRRHRASRSPYAVSRLLVTPHLAPEDLLDLVEGRRRQGRILLAPLRPGYRIFRTMKRRVGRGS